MTFYLFQNVCHFLAFLLHETGSSCRKGAFVILQSPDVAKSRMNDSLLPGSFWREEVFSRSEAIAKDRNSPPPIFSSPRSDRMPAHVTVSDPEGPGPGWLSIGRFCSKILLFHLRTLSRLISDLDQIGLIRNKSPFGGRGLMLAGLSPGG